MDTTNEIAGGSGSHVLVSGAFEGSRICDLDPSDLAFEARRGCCQSEDRAAMRAYISALKGRRDDRVGRG